APPGADRSETSLSTQSQRRDCPSSGWAVSFATGHEGMSERPITYYDWRPAELTLLEEDVTVLMRAGVPDSDPLGPAPGLLVDEATIEPGERVLVLEPSSGALTIATAWQAETGQVDALCS